MAGCLGLDELFEGRHFDREIVVLCVRWYLRFKLSFRDLVEMMAECGLSMAHTTIMRWVHHYAPEFERRWNQFARSVRSVVARRRDLREDPRQVGLFIPGGRSRWKDCRLSAQHQARCHRGQGVLLQGDQSARSGAADYRIGRLCGIASRRERYASWWATSNRHEATLIKVSDNLIEQDHRGVKLRIGP